jgi:polysaccharide export outer membrane protein
MRKQTRFLRKLAQLAVALIAIPINSFAAESTAQTERVGYKLSVRDRIEVVIFDEPELTVAQRIDGNGQIRVPMLGTITVTGKTVREAEDFVENEYVTNRLLKRPMATIRVLEYAIREISVHGSVSSPGSLTFPPEVDSMDIIEVIAKSGGFADKADGRNVRIPRIIAEGDEEVIEINVEAMITGKSRDPKRVLDYPGDVLFIPTRPW